MGKNGLLFLILCTLLAIFVLPPIAPAPAEILGPKAPAPDPPLELQKPASLQPLTPTRAAAPLTEWALHKTQDSSHPDGNEQQMLWLMNRARVNPAQEGVWLATSDLSDIANGRDYFGVDLMLLEEEFSQIAAKAPAAFDARLYYAAQEHSQDLIARDSQDHIGQFDAITANGFSYTAARGNVFYYAFSAINSHAAFNIDWGGSDASGMQSGRGHRLAVMAMDGEYTNVGLAVVVKPSGNFYEGYYAVTGNYCQARTSAANHYNRFLVGTVWDDLNANAMYDPGEGLADVRVTPDQGAYYAVTAAGGGYAIPITASGTFEIVFSDGDLGGSYTRSATVGSQSVLLDLCITTEGPDDPVDTDDPPPTSDPEDPGDPADPPPDNPVDPGEPLDPSPSDPSSPDLPVDPGNPDNPVVPDNPSQVVVPQSAADGGGGGCFISIL